MIISIANEIWGATNTPSKTTYEKTNNNIAINALQVLRDIAWEKAIKYRFDPVVGEAHEEYLTLLNGILKECES